jgi:hypothetical protein
MGRKGRREKEKRVLASRTRATLLVDVLEAKLHRNIGVGVDIPRLLAKLA